MAIISKPTNSSARTESAIVSKRVKRMFGLSLHSWENVMVVSLVIAGAIALFVGFATWMVIKLQRAEIAASMDEFERYKIEAAKEIASAHEKAAQSDFARAELEDKLRPRMLNQAQWDFIKGLAGKFEQVNIGYETDAETWWYATDVQKAFFNAGIRVGMYRRAAEVHSFGTLIYEPHGFEGSRARTIEPLVEIFRKGDIPPARVALAVITSLPTDIEAPSEIPMIILGGRFLVAPASAPDPRIIKQDAPK